MKLPDRIFGISTKEALDRWLAKEAEKEKKKPEQEVIIPSNIKDPNNYIVLESRTHSTYSYPDTLVELQRAHLGSNWNQAQELLQQEGSYMLTIRQFADFLTLLSSGKAYDGSGSKLPKQRLTQILDEIIEGRDSWREEWLDAKFSQQGKSLYMTYHKIAPDGTIQETIEPLEPCLMEDKTPGIDIAYWLNNATSQGLPIKNTPEGNIYYWHPTEDKVAWLGACSFRAGFGCGRDPQFSYSALGVRRAKIKV